MTKANWSKENLSKIVKESYSIADVLRNLGLEPKGGNYSNAWKWIHTYNLNTDHFTGQIWTKSPLITLESRKLIPLEDILQENVNFKSDTLKKRLIEAGLKENKCEICGITEWQNKPVSFELHHINGNHYDNRLENLQILCPNCHSQTDTYRKRMNVRKNENTICNTTNPQNLTKKLTLQEKECPICHKLFKPVRKTQKYCSRECSYAASRITASNNPVELTEVTLRNAIEQCNNIAEVASLLNTSRPTIRKYLDKFGLLEDFKAKFDFRAIPVLQFDSNNNFIKEWPSISDAENTLKIDGVGKCCRHERKSAGGYIWKYKDA